MEQVEGPRVYRIAKKVLHRPLQSAFDVHVECADQIPDSGPAIVAANHRSFMDSIFLAHVVQRPVAFLAKAEYFEKRRTAWIFHALGQIPVRRGSPGGARSALEGAVDVLESGGIVGVYPEGTRSRDGLLHRGNFGPARLSLATGAPIIPIGLIGTEAVQAPDHRLPCIGKRVQVRIGEAIRPDPTTNERRQLRDLTQRLMLDISALSGQTYIDANRRRSDRPVEDGRMAVAAAGR